MYLGYKRFLQALFCSVLLLGNVIAAADEGYGIYEDHPYQFVVSKTVSRFSESYMITQPKPEHSAYLNTYPGKIKKSVFRMKTTYDLSDANGWQATGSIRLISLGLVYSWASVIDIYDTRGVKIGVISGSMATLESAKFALYSYDENGYSSLVGIALANADFTHFAITTPQNSLSIADLQRDLSKNVWTVLVTTPGIIDDRLVRIFAGFLVDYQDKF
jgi:hypothetical protein